MFGAQGDLPFITGQDGQNVAALQASQMGQTLGVLLQPNTTYHLSFLGGIGLFGTDYLLSVSLIAVDNLQVLPLIGHPGVKVLAMTQGLIPPRDTFGTMQRYSLDYTTPATLPANLAGRYVGIHMFGSDGLPRVLYDDFSLDATPIPGPSVLAAVGLSLAVRPWRRRGRNHWASHS
jgi:hypothetical protein